MSVKLQSPEQLQLFNRTFVIRKGRRLSYFSGCDYFRLSTHSKVRNALQDGLKRYGLNVAASRVTTGNHALYGQLEEKLRSFFRAPAALVTPTGYSCASIATQALAGEFSHVIVDSRAHAALVDAALFLNCSVLRFKSQDVSDLAKVIRRTKKGASILLMTDGMFSHDGSVPPLDQYLTVVSPQTVLLVDDSHAAGIVGRTGRGSIEHTGIPRSRVIQCVTLSKAMGSYGGAILGTKALRAKIMQKSRQFIGTTPLPLPLAAAAMASLELLQKDQSFLNRLRSNSDLVKERIRSGGLEIPDSPGPIIRLVPRDATAAKRFSEALLKAGIYPALTRYLENSGPGYFRLVISSEHSRGQLMRLCDVILQHAEVLAT